MTKERVRVKGRQCSSASACQCWGVVWVWCGMWRTPHLHDHVDGVASLHPLLVQCLQGQQRGRGVGGRVRLKGREKGGQGWNVGEVEWMAVAAAACGSGVWLCVCVM